MTVSVSMQISHTVSSKCFVFICSYQSQTSKLSYICVEGLSLVSTSRQGVFDQSVGLINMDTYHFELDKDNVVQSNWVFGL